MPKKLDVLWLHATYTGTQEQTWQLYFTRTGARYKIVWHSVLDYIQSLNGMLRHTIFDVSMNYLDSPQSVRGPMAPLALDLQTPTPLDPKP